MLSELAVFSRLFYIMLCTLLSPNEGAQFSYYFSCTLGLDFVLCWGGALVLRVRATIQNGNIPTASHSGVLRLDPFP